MYVQEKPIAARMRMRRIAGSKRGEMGEYSFANMDGGGEGKRKERKRALWRYSGRAPSGGKGFRIMWKCNGQRRILPRRNGESPSNFTAHGDSLLEAMDQDEMILDRLYRPNACLAHGPETGRPDEAAELSHGGAAMIAKSKDIDWRRTKRCWRDTRRAVRRNSCGRGSRADEGIFRSEGWSLYDASG